MMKCQYKLTLDLKINPKIFLSVADELEISLPCVNCKRNHRTIIFEKVNKSGICTPREKCKGFSGQLTNREIVKETNNVKINYLIELDYEPFFDSKYNKESNFGQGWDRVYFIIKCSQCGKREKISTQENISRPHDKICECGNFLFKEEKSPFKYQISEIY